MLLKCGTKSHCAEHVNFTAQHLKFQKIFNQKLNRTQYFDYSTEGQYYAYVPFLSSYWSIDMSCIQLSIYFISLCSHKESMTQKVILNFVICNLTIVSFKRFVLSKHQSDLKLCRSQHLIRYAYLACQWDEGSPYILYKYLHWLYMHRLLGNVPTDTGLHIPYMYVLQWLYCTVQYLHQELWKHGGITCDLVSTEQCHSALISKCHLVI